MNKKLFLFDLDGTLSDSSEGITKAVSYALESFGIEVPDRKELSCFIGPPLPESFQKFYIQKRQGIEIYLTPSVAAS